ncbi:hypothetical protein RZS08_25525, partial [Arthrospira platensis SPKY1]|nr:hypothetical protein [Arthrospira platensis SPKY1]
VGVGIRSELLEDGMELIGVQEVRGEAAVLSGLNAANGFVQTLVGGVDHHLELGVGDGGWVGGEEEGGSADIGDGIVQLVYEDSMGLADFDEVISPVLLGGQGFA